MRRERDGADTVEDQQKQQRTEAWFKARHGKINASTLGSVVGLTNFRNKDGLTDQKVAFDRLRHELKGDPGEPGESNDAMEWGQLREDEARNAYAAYMQEFHGGVGEISDVGSISHSMYPWLAASPDGLVGDNGLVEIKCPFNARFDEPRTFVYESYRLQVNLQLEITEREWCDLCIWTTKGLYIERIERSTELFNYMRETYYRPFFEAASAPFTDVLPVIDPRGAKKHLSDQSGRTRCSSHVHFHLFPIEEVSPETAPSPVELEGPVATEPPTNVSPEGGASFPSEEGESS
jgi:putative phage-type endonuclease